MRSKNRVVWTEGLFIKPQHFQQETEHFKYILKKHADLSEPYSYGFSNLELDEENLRVGKVVIRAASGVMPDGSVFEMPSENNFPAPIEIDTNEVANQIIYMALPLSSDGITEIQWQEGSQTVSRYTKHEQEAKDTQSKDGDNTLIGTAQYNTKLMLESEDRSSYTYLAMAKISGGITKGDRDSGKEVQSLILDTNYLPTLITVPVNSILHRFTSEVTDLMSARADDIAKRISSPTQAGVADVSDFMMLQALNRLAPRFTHLCSLKTLHPERLYTLCIEACGELNTFFDRNNRLPEEYPSYNHDDLTSTFAPIFNTLRECLGQLLQPRAVPIPITEQKYGIYTAQIHEKSLIETATFVLAVKARINGEKIRSEFPQQSKITSLEKLNELINLQLPGIPLIPTPTAPSKLPYHAGFIYFELDQASPAWATIKGSSGFGFHITGNFPDLELEFWAIRSN